MASAKRGSRPGSRGGDGGVARPAPRPSRGPRDSHRGRRRNRRRHRSRRVRSASGRGGRGAGGRGVGQARHRRQRCRSHADRPGRRSRSGRLGHDAVGERAGSAVRDSRCVTAPDRRSPGFAARRRRRGRHQFDRRAGGPTGNRRLCVDEIRRRGLLRSRPSGGVGQARPRRPGRTRDGADRDHQQPPRRRSGGHRAAQPRHGEARTLRHRRRRPPHGDADRRVAVNDILVRSAEQTW